MTYRSPEERAEELMERLATEGSRRLSRFVGRAREELEDIFAEARTLNNQRSARRNGGHTSSGAPGSSDKPAAAAPNENPATPARR